jgi:pyruvate dehydrogenase E2 component (dihydrolipoamide acetyltransferase)
MNTSQKLRALVLASMLGSSAAQAGDPQPAPDVAALMALLNSLAAASADDAAPTAEAAPAPIAPAPAPRAPAAPAATASQPAPSALRTGSLSTSGLTASGSLGGRGPAPVIRLSEADWRVLFSSKPARN